jgi:uncharacterized Zn finger protein
MTPTQQKEREKYITRLINTTNVYKEFEIICGNCGEQMFKYIIYYPSNYDVNIAYLIDYRCPNCGQIYKEIQL